MVEKPAKIWDQLVLIKLKTMKKLGIYLLKVKIEKFR